MDVPSGDKARDGRNTMAACTAAQPASATIKPPTPAEALLLELTAASATIIATVAAR